jgi:hypothetical protein
LSFTVVRHVPGRQESESRIPECAFLLRLEKCDLFCFEWLPIISDSGLLRLAFSSLAGIWPVEAGGWKAMACVARDGKEFGGRSGAGQGEFGVVRILQLRTVAQVGGRFIFVEIQIDRFFYRRRE